MWSRVIERHNCLRAVIPDRKSEPCMNEIKSIIPGNTFELITTIKIPIPKY